MHRPEVYAPDDVGLRGLAELIVAKYRHGKTGTVELAWAGATTSFRNRPEPAGQEPTPNAGLTDASSDENLREL